MSVPVVFAVLTLGPLLRTVAPDQPQPALQQQALRPSDYRTKMNVSQEEYTRTFNTYIKRLREKDYSSSYNKKYFLTFTHSGDRTGSVHSRRQFEFKTRLRRGSKVERATFRLLVSGEDCREVRFSQVTREGEVRELETVRPEVLPQWRGVDADWEDGARFRVDGKGCRLDSPALHLLFQRPQRRTARSTGQLRVGPTDCRPETYRPTAKKQRCCRHKMDVVFKELPGYEFILQPYRFDAGYCKGSCPYRYNPANHHASLQSLVYRQKKGAAPKPCCSPSKLEQLEIIHGDEDDPTKLQVTTWSNMKVVECACS